MPIIIQKKGELFMKWVILFLFITLSHNSFSQLRKNSYKWGKIDNPDDFLIGYETRFKDLPLKGKLKKHPWSGYYWATFNGGLAFRWHGPDKGKSKQVTYPLLTKEEVFKRSKIPNALKYLSPAEKWDLYMSDYTFSLTRSERERTGVMKGKKIPKWFGLCHAWAPATLQYTMPKPIELKNYHGLTIPFGSSDIKALLTYNIHLYNSSEDQLFMGGRCNSNLPYLLKSFANGLITEEMLTNLIPNMNCQDMNPGALHLALANLIGLRKQGFIMDKTRTGEVWNQPVWSYNSVIEKESVVKSINDLVGFKKDHEILLPEKILKVKTTVGWINEHGPNWEGPDKKGHSLKTTTYQYYLYINRYGHIVGGKWHPRNKERPDFFWRMKNPGYHDYMKYLSHFEGRSFNLSSNMDTKGRKRSIKQLKKVFKRATKKLILAKRFIKNSKEINGMRRKRKKTYTDNLKDYFLKNMNSLKKKYKKFRGNNP